MIKETLTPAGQEFLLDPEIVFLNHGSFGACPRPVFTEYQRWERLLESQPVAFLSRELDAYLEQARTALAAYVYTAADNLVFIPNATHALNIVARSLALQRGDEIVASDHEYGAAARCWQFICRQTGAWYREAPITLPLSNDETIVDEFWNAVTPRTQAIFLSHITSPTALRFPIAAICRRARSAGILTIVDGAHAPGQVHIDLDEIGADFYFGNCHKWLCAPKGSAFLYVRPEQQEHIQPLIVSWGYDGPQMKHSRFQDLFSWTGTINPCAYLSVPAAITFQAANHWGDVQAASHQLAQEAQQQITALFSTTPIAEHTMCDQMCSIPLPPCDHVVLQQQLYDEYAIEVPFIAWRNNVFVRISIQAYNSYTDIDRLITALTKLKNSTVFCK